MKRFRLGAQALALTCALIALPTTLSAAKPETRPAVSTAAIPTDYKEISFVCLRPDGCLELPSTLSIACRSVAKRLDGFENFHFHQLRHTYTSNLLSNGAAPKDVQELLGHSDVSTTMNVYAHSTRKAKRNSARLLDKVAGND